MFNVIGNAALTIPFGIDAAARLTWATELFVAVLASPPLWRRAPAAARRLAALLAVLTTAVLGADLGPPAHRAWLLEVALHRQAEPSARS